tara:strand:- start:15 stop:494 length:480 start_codon:yes stop_codon:yes gene_type:complete
MKDILILRATPKYAKNLYELDKFAEKEIKWWVVPSLDDQKSLIKNKKNLILLAKNDEEFVGFLYAQLKNYGTYLNPKLKEKYGKKYRISLERIYVKKEYRNKGISNKLVSKLREYRKNNYWKEKIQGIELLTEDKNIKIFEKLGFKKVMNYMNSNEDRK